MKDKKLILFSLFMSCCAYALLVFLEQANTGKKVLFVLAGDSNEYLCFGESMLRGEYICEGSLFKRMPAYPSLYAFFRLFTGAASAIQLLVWLQVLISGIATCMLVLISKSILNVPLNRYLLATIFAFSLVFKAFDLIVITESLAVSMLIFSVYYTLKPHRNKWDYLAIGVAFTFLVFLRPFAVIVLPVMGTYLLYAELKSGNNKALIFKNLFIVMLPLLLAEGGWMLRNYKLSGRIIPFQENIYAGFDNSSVNQDAYISIWNWMRAIGEDAVFWNPGSLGSWMYESSFKPDTLIYKEHMLAPGYNQADIDRLRDLYQLQLKSTQSQEKDSINKVVLEQTNAMIASYKQAKPLQYYLFGTIRIFARSFFHSGPVIPVPPYPEILKSPIKLAVKIWSICSYLAILILGFLGMIFSLRKGPQLMLAVMIMALTGLLVVILRYTEFRLYVMVFPLLALFCTALLGRILGWCFRNRKQGKMNWLFGY